MILLNTYIDYPGIIILNSRTTYSLYRDKGMRVMEEAGEEVITTD